MTKHVLHTKEIKTAQMRERNCCPDVFIGILLFRMWFSNHRLLIYIFYYLIRNPVNIRLIFVFC